MDELKPLTMKEVESWPALGPMNLDPKRVKALLLESDELRSERDQFLVRIRRAMELSSTFDLDLQNILSGNAAHAQLIRKEEGVSSKLAVEMAELEKRRLKLWLHLVSEHKAQMDPFEPLESLEDMHKHEHHGPGGIRNHPEDSRAFSLAKVGKVLAEDEDVDYEEED